MRMMLAWLGVGGVLAGGFLLFLAIRKSAAPPPLRLPDPAGIFPVGTSMVFFDDVRRDRPISAQIWYPRNPGPCNRLAPYFPCAEWRHPGAFANTRTHGCWEADPAGSHWPVVIYSPGWDGGSFQGTTLCETMASSGFVVVALNHPGGSPAVKIPGGGTRTNEKLERFDLSDEASSDAFFRAADRELESRAADVRFVIDCLAALNSGERAGGKFQNRLAVDKIGVAGYSFGGAVAGEVCRTDPRVGAGVNLDGCFFGKARRAGSSRPFLILTDNRPPPPESDLVSPVPAIRRNAKFLEDGNLDYEYWREKSGALLVRIEGAEHQDFTDEAILSGKESAGRLTRINRCVAEFFEKTLLGKRGGLFENPAAMPWPDFLSAAPQPPGG